MPSPHDYTRLLEEEFGRVRTPCELSHWVDHRKTEILEIIQGGNDELAASFRSRAGVFKPFLEEAVPISEFLQSFGRPGDSIALRLGNQNFDAEWAREDGRAQFLEVTYPIDGEFTALQMQHLNEHGHAPATLDAPTATFRRRLRNGEIVWADAVDKATTIAEQNKRIIAAARKKFAKTPPYPANTTLLIADYFDLDEDAENCVGTIRTEFRNRGQFLAVFLVSLGKSVLQIF
jgi:hypothetical protein